MVTHDRELAGNIPRVEEVRNGMLVSPEEMIDASKRSAENQASRFGIVTSGELLDSPQEISTVSEALKTSK